MFSFNKVVLVGNVGKDPEIKSKNNKKIAIFSIAVSESYKDKGGERITTTDWHKIVVFNDGLANIIEKHIHKGSKVLVEGSLKKNKYTDKNGIERETTDIVANTVVMLDKFEKKSDGFNAPIESFFPELKDEIPF